MLLDLKGLLGRSGLAPPSSGPSVLVCGLSESSFVENKSNVIRSGVGQPRRNNRSNMVAFPTSSPASMEDAAAGAAAADQAIFGRLPADRTTTTTTTTSPIINTDSFPKQAWMDSARCTGPRRPPSSSVPAETAKRQRRAEDNDLYPRSGGRI